MPAAKGGLYFDAVSIRQPMNARCNRTRSIAFAFLALGSGMVLAAKASAADVPPSAKSAKEKANTAASEVEKLRVQFNSQRDRLLAEREALTEKLKTANEAQKKEILAKLEAQSKALVDAARAQGKQIRDEMRKQRQDALPVRN